MQKNKIFSIALTAVGAILCIISLVFLIKSYEYYDDGFGISLGFDGLKLSYLLASIVLLCGGIYSLVKMNTQEFDFIQVLTVSLIIASSLVLCFGFGDFFKGLAKEKPVFKVEHFVAGLCGTVVFGISLVFYFLRKKKN